MKRMMLLAAAGAAMVIFGGCSSSGWNPSEEEGAQTERGSGPVALTISRFKNRDPGIDRFFDSAYGYAIFPAVGKGGLGIGAAHGEGEVYEQGALVGYSTMTQITVGLQLGGQKYSEILFFRDAEAFEDFTRGNFEPSAQASAIAVTAGASTDAAYDGGVAIFTMPLGGLMYEASVGGQKFSYDARK